MSFSENIFGRPHFDHFEVPGVLHNALEQLFVGRFFKFLIQIPAVGRTPGVESSNGYAAIAKILPLQHNFETSIVSILKDQYLGPSASHHSSSLDLALHKHITPFDSVSDSSDTLGASCTDETSLIEVQSFSSYDIESKNTTEQDTSRSIDLRVVSPSNTSHDNASYARTLLDTVATPESTPSMLGLLCDLLNQSSPLATTAKSNSTPLFARTQSTQPVSLRDRLGVDDTNKCDHSPCYDKQARERSVEESPHTWFDSELASDVALQHEIVQELEGAWPLTPSVSVLSTLPEANESPKGLQSLTPLRDREVVPSSSVFSEANSIPLPSTSDGEEAKNHFSDSISEMDILGEIVSEWESTQRIQKSPTRPVNNSHSTCRNQPSPSLPIESGLRSPFVLEQSQSVSAPTNGAASPDLFSVNSSVTSLGSCSQFSPDLFSSRLCDPPPSVSLTKSSSNTSQATLLPSKLTFSVPSSYNSTPHIAQSPSKVQTPLSHFRHLTNSQVRESRGVPVSTPLHIHRHTSPHSKARRQRTKIIKFADTIPLTGYSTPSHSKQNDSKPTAEKTYYNTSTPLSSQQFLPEFSPDIL